MDAKEVGRELLNRVCEYLISLPFDAKILQEGVADLDLDRGGREHAAGVLIHVLSHHEGSGPERYLDDVFLVRAALQRLAPLGGDGAEAFHARFPELYESLEGDVALFQQALGEELWQRVLQRTESFSRLSLKGRRAAQFVEDEEGLEMLYDEGLAFQTNYNLSETQVRNRLRRADQIVEHLQRRYAEGAAKR